MLARKRFKLLDLMTTMPTTTANEWLSSAEDGANFMVEDAGSPYTVISASLPHVYISAVLAPYSQLVPPDIDDLSQCDFIGSTHWIIQRSYGGGDDHRIYLEAPLSHNRCNSLTGGEPLVFRRSFDGMKDHIPPTELNQRLVHALELHFIPERNAYCRLNDEGDLEDIICIFDERADEWDKSKRAVLISSSELHKYMAVSGQAMYRKFDFTRVDIEQFSGWGDPQRKTVRNASLFYNSGLLPGHASYINGGQVIAPSITVDDMVEEWRRERDSSLKLYETFKIIDWKNGQHVECSCAPGEIANYFTVSDRPYEVSPAFFKPQVLQKYKADPEKYEIGDRTISCRNSWSLKTYDINEAGQVHTYIVYLAALPYSEQQHWKLYNVWPKAPISKRAYENDFLGDFASERDPLQGIRDTVRAWDKAEPVWWKRRGEEISGAVLYPATDSSKEWADELLALDQLVVEGFVASELRRIATNIDAAVERDWQSLKILQIIVETKGATNEDAAKLLEPLRRLHHLRSKLRGHATPEKRLLEREAIATHGSYLDHFISLCRGCDASLAGLHALLMPRDAAGSI